MPDEPMNGVEPETCRLGVEQDGDPGIFPDGHLRRGSRHKAPQHPVVLRPAQGLAVDGRSVISQALDLVAGQQAPEKQVIDGLFGSNRLIRALLRAQRRPDRPIP
jgi:hypothetical protein